jgi:hypothetical protein
MPDLIPAKDGIHDRHPVADRSEKALDSLRGEFIEPRVEPGMTINRFDESIEFVISDFGHCDLFVV